MDPGAAVVEVDLGAYAAVEESEGGGCGGKVGLVVIEDVPGQVIVGGRGVGDGDFVGLGSRMRAEGVPQSARQRQQSRQMKTAVRLRCDLWA